MSPARPPRAPARRAIAMSLLRRRWWLAGMAVAVVVAVVAIVAVTRRPHDRYLPPPRAREYRDYTACLLTGEEGLSDPGATAVWAGLQDASAATLIQVSYLAAVGPDTVDNAAPYAASLIQRKCDLIVAVGGAQSRAAGQQAAGHPQIRFVLVAAKPDGGDQRSGPNVSTVPAGQPSDVRSAVAAIVEQAVRR